MRIGMIDVDGFGTKRNCGGGVYPNLAICKLTAWHRSHGDHVEWYDALLGGHYDKVYVSKIFVFTPDYPYAIHADAVEYGGTGYDIKKVLPKDVDDMQPDYSLYPDVDNNTSYGFLSRGCPNHCAWCIVPEKEGRIRPYWDIERVANGRKHVVLMDNNILGLREYAMEQMRKASSLGLHIDFNQAMDARLVDDDVAGVMAKTKWIKNRIRFGCDTSSQIHHCIKAMDMIRQHGFRGDFMIYTMLHGTFAECYNRINVFRDRLTNRIGSQCYPYAQPYRDLTNPAYKPPQWQKDMATWCNKRMIFATTTFGDFSPRKGFRCQWYIDHLMNDAI